MKLNGTLFAGIAALALVAPGAAAAQDLRAGVAEDMPELMELYRDLHANPELSFEEHKTAAKLAKRMRDLGFEVTEGVGRTGVVSVMKNGDGPTVLLRADMDGLPVVEQTGLPFASKVTATPASGVTTGVMHACGHDTHMAGFIGAAQQLVDHKDQWQGTLVMVLQPAEELGLGALAMLEDGLYTRFPKPDYALAFHDAAAPAPAGTIGYTPGYALANVDSVDITVKGVGGHGAYPHTTVDPIVLASNMVMQFQTIVSRNSSPLDPAVITVGSFHSGAKHNIISDEAKLQLTVRSYSDESRTLLLDGIRRVARGAAMTAGLPEELIPVVTVEDPYTPSTFNDPDFTQARAAAFRERFGEERVMEWPAVMGGEDFSQFRRAAPDDVESMIFWISGTPAPMLQALREDGTPLPSLHSPYWAPDAEAVIATGAEALAGAAMDLMPRG
ncbi:amidohydrolase [Erythrobacter sp. A6_0]|uniref:amidohydrolase n=1 Tax=Erythrobacter sp. A6_0 TaxID=2821089 RepID=UPI001ADAE565|nr:amidohydrolase [Erythrobacter sp. A6_0]MBO9510793.1 amidohydrolase [Erythrobacter sp. A6_0]